MEVQNQPTQPTTSVISSQTPPPVPQSPAPKKKSILRVILLIILLLLILSGGFSFYFAKNKKKQSSTYESPFPKEKSTRDLEVTRESEVEERPSQTESVDWCPHVKEVAVKLGSDLPDVNELLSYVKVPIFPGSCLSSAKVGDYFGITTSSASYKEIYDFYVNEFNKLGGVKIIDDTPYTVFIQLSGTDWHVQIPKSEEEKTYEHYYYELFVPE